VLLLLLLLPLVLLLRPLLHRCHGRALDRHQRMHRREVLRLLLLLG
jgi:hypothetical protein